MKIYHGSTICVPEPRLLAATRRLDFGPGFYATSDLKQAKEWALIKKRRLMAPHAIVSFYDASAVLNDRNLNIKCFAKADAEWLDFVMAHRVEAEPPAAQYDVIRGPVANDTLYETLALYESGILTHAETIVRLRTHELADQVVFTTQQALSLLRYDACEEVT